MKQNETSNQKELENINSEMFHSFDPDDASWIIGGAKKKFTAKATGSGDGADVEFDFEIEF
jgi:hypothetical protein